MSGALTEYPSGAAAPVVPSQLAHSAQLASNTIKFHDPNSASQRDRKIAWSGHLEWIINTVVSDKPFCFRVDTSYNHA